MTQKRWEDEIDALFEVLDPRNRKTQEESDKAVDKFIESINADKENEQEKTQC